MWLNRKGYWIDLRILFIMDHQLCNWLNCYAGHLFIHHSRRGTRRILDEQVQIADQASEQINSVLWNERPSTLILAAYVLECHFYILLYIWCFKVIFCDLLFLYWLKFKKYDSLTKIWSSIKIIRSEIISYQFTSRERIPRIRRIRIGHPGRQRYLRIVHLSFFWRASKWATGAEEWIWGADGEWSDGCCCTHVASSRRRLTP